MLYVIKNRYFMSDYIFQAFDASRDVWVMDIEHLRPKGLKKIPYVIKKYIRTFWLNRKGLWSLSFYKKSFLEKLKGIEEKDNVLLLVKNLKDILILQEEILPPPANTKVFIWDSVPTICRNAYSRWEYSHYLGKSGMRVYTFDEEDAEKYKFLLTRQFYRFDEDMAVKTGNRKTDVFFIGKDKGRSCKLSFLLKCLKEQGISSKFLVVRDKHTEYMPELAGCYINEEVEYEEVLQYVMSSRCIVEILQQGQGGMTLRTMEALFFGKKLITNNVNIRHAPFYHPENIYIVDKDEDKWPLADFLDSPMVQIPVAVIQQYHVKNWIKQFDSVD